MSSTYYISHKITAFYLTSKKYCQNVWVNRNVHHTGVRLACFSGGRPTYVHPVVSFRLTNRFHWWRVILSRYCAFGIFLHLPAWQRMSPLTGGQVHIVLPDSVGVLVARVALLSKMFCAGTPCIGLQVAEPRVTPFVSKSSGPRRF